MPSSPDPLYAGLGQAVRMGTELLGRADGRWRIRLGR